MRLRLIIGGIVVLALGLGLLGRENAARPKVVAVLAHASVTEAALAGLRSGLALHGWREGDNLRLIYDGPETSAPQLRARARAYAAQGVDLMVALSTPAAQAAIEATEPARIPLLLAPSSDPVAAGLVRSPTRPGRQVTGISFALQEPRRLEWLSLLLPDARRIWLPYDHSDPSPAQAMSRLREAAQALGLELVTADIRGQAELENALAALPDDIDAIMVPADARLASLLDPLRAAADARGLPLTTPHAEGVARGALFSFGFQLDAVGRQAARQADLILRGAKAADLPVEVAEMKLFLNLATADRLGLVIPEDFLRHAIIHGREERAR